MDFSGCGHWAVILGGSSGFGLAAAHELSSRGMHLCLVHRDRQGEMPRINAEFEKIRSRGTSLLAFNANALLADQRTAVLEKVSSSLAGGKVRVLLHSIAAGSLKPLAPDRWMQDVALLSDQELAETIYGMGTSLYSWTRDIFTRGLFASDARVIGLTSEGNQVAWHGYGAVSAAKAALESISRGLAKEFAPHGVRANIVQPGITDTPAFRMIPNSAALRASAEQRNPFGRLTTPQDVAKIIALLASDEAAWINGSIIKADGGESISG